MSLKRDMLVEAGVTDKDAIDKIMQAYGAGLEKARHQVKLELTAEVKQALEKLQEEYNQFKVDSDNKLAQISKTNAIALALKDVKAHDSDVLMKLIDVDKIELGEDGKPKLDEVVNSLKESKPFLFEQEQQQTTPQITVGGNPNGNGTASVDPFQAILDQYTQ